MGTRWRGRGACSGGRKIGWLAILSLGRWRIAGILSGVSQGVLPGKGFPVEVQEAAKTLGQRGQALDRGRHDTHGHNREMSKLELKTTT